MPHYTEIGDSVFGKLSFVGLTYGICELGNIELNSTDAVFISPNYPPLYVSPYCMYHHIYNIIYTTANNIYTRAQFTKVA